MNKLTLSRHTLESMVAQAEHEFPSECCGFVIGDGTIEELRPVRNIQDEKHAADPASFPRDAKTAYLMDPKQQLAILREVDERRLRLKVLYHSHPDHDAYFSATDRARACSFDPAEPDYPDTAYVVMSIRGGKFVRAACFVWDGVQGDFVEASLHLA